LRSGDSLYCEAIWDSFSSDDSLASSDTESSESEQVFLAISKSALSVVHEVHTISLLGHIQQVPVHVLIDSGSSSSFISETLVHQLHGMPSRPSHIAVQVAGRGFCIAPVSCNKCHGQLLTALSTLICVFCRWENLML
jgi:hypothetical protein